MFDARPMSDPRARSPARRIGGFGRTSARARNSNLTAASRATRPARREKTRAIADWVAEHGSEEQRARMRPGVLPVEEVIDALDRRGVRGASTDMPRYQLDGAARLQAHLRAVTGRASIAVVGPADLQVVGVGCDGRDGRDSGPSIRQLQARLPDADVTLREHRLSLAPRSCPARADRVRGAGDAPGRTIHRAARVRRAREVIPTTQPDRRHLSALACGHPGHPSASPDAEPLTTSSPQRPR